MDWGLVVVLLCISVPVSIVFGLYFWSNRNDRQDGTRFLGTQMDIAILIFGIFILLLMAGWIRKAFFG